jgi:hypothetical protein
VKLAAFCVAVSAKFQVMVHVPLAMLLTVVCVYVPAVVAYGAASVIEQTAGVEVVTVRKLPMLLSPGVIALLT